MTRRDLLKTGLAASAGLIGGEDAFQLSVAAAEAQSTPASSSSRPDPQFDELRSPGERLLLDFGWRFHLGNADDATKDFRYGAPMREGTFSKAGQDWLHNPADDSLQHSFDDSAWRVVDLPHDWAVELPYITVDGAGESILAAHGGKALGRNYPETSIGWYQRTFHVPATDEGMRLSSSSTAYFATPSFSSTVLSSAET